MERVHSPPRIWIDDHHPIFRRGLAACLDAQGFTVIGESVGTAPIPDPERMDVLVFEATAQSVRSVETKNGSVPLVAIVSDADDEIVGDAISAGVCGILVRGDLDVEALGHAIWSAIAGNSTVPRAALAQLLERRPTNGDDARNLTEREMKVLQLLSEGDDTRQIASSLSYSERTVKNIVRDMLVKLNCKNRTHAVATAARRGLI